MFRSRKIFAALVVAATVAFAVGAYAAIGPPASAKPVTATATVQRGAVLSSVTATGNASATALSLNFATAGTVTEIDVTVGQHVTVGQVLAKVNPASARSHRRSGQPDQGASRDLDRAERFHERPVGYLGHAAAGTAQR